MSGSTLPSKAMRVSPAKSHSSHQASLQQTTFSTFDSSLSPAIHDDADEGEQELIHQQGKRERHTTSSLDRLKGLPDDRLGMIARALANAGTSYIEEAPHTHGSAQFFEKTVDRALLPLLDPHTVTRSVGRSFSLVDLEEADLVHLIGNMKMVLASQREEIHCLRMTVQELVVEIADAQSLTNAPRVPNFIEVEDSSSETSIDKRIFRNRKYNHRTPTSSRKDTKEGYSYLLSSIARSKSSSDSNLHIEPEGRYMSEVTRAEYPRVERKNDPPSSVNDAASVLHPSASWDDPGTESCHNKISHESKDGKLREKLTNRSSDGKQVPALEGVDKQVRTDQDKKSAEYAASQASSPSREYAKRIVQERRRRYQNFRRSRETEISKRKEWVPRNENDSITRPQPSTANKTIGGSVVDSMRTRNSTPTGNQSMPPMVRFREDELTLMETTARTMDPGDD